MTKLFGSAHEHKGDVLGAMIYQNSVIFPKIEFLIANSADPDEMPHR